MLKTSAKVLDFSTFCLYNVNKEGDTMKDIIDAIINNGAAVGLLAYFVFRDYKYINNLTVSINTLQLTLDELRKDILCEREVKQIE